MDAGESTDSPTKTSTDERTADAVQDKEEVSPLVVAKNEIKSSAAVKYSSVECVAEFSKLKQDTDLKLPPANWLRSCAKLTVNNTWGTSRTKFSSFGMADSCPETVGEVDVISASENIKTLLKIPFSKAQVSIAVHRIGRTLFLDEFDVYRHLLSAPQSGRDWLRNFIIHQIRGKKFTRKRKTRDDLHSRSLLSKFLYYSIDSVENTEPYSVNEPEDTQPPGDAGTRQPDKDPMVMTSEDTQNPCPSEFARQVLWHFEDIQMLIGSDLPIFGGGKYPSVSLRLRDESKPINVLTGLDYWLDNLICNVPELAMCYHLNGIVQNYELLKTEEIPQIRGSQFKPGVVKDIAQNVLSFMKSNCTKEGHTYWLFKGNNDDIVKLYDLTSLCSEEEESDPTSSTWDNPFSVPVAMLLYKVARNMKKSETGHRHKATISKLLRNCLTLLDKDKHPQIVTSANYMLCDNYISDDPHKDKRDDESSSDDNTDSSSDGDKDEDRSPVSLEVKSLCQPAKHWHWREIETHISSTSGCRRRTREEKCQEAMSYIVAGLTIIDSDIESKSTVSRNTGQCAIEFPTAKEAQLNPATNESPDKDANQGESHTLTVAKRKLSPCSWQDQLKFSLLKKARAVCYVCANVNMKQNEYGEVLRYLQLALFCHSAVSSYTGVESDLLCKDEENSLLGAIFGMCGDVHIMLASDPDSISKFKSDFLQQTSQERIIVESVKKEVSFNNFEWAVTFSEDMNGCLVTSIRSYETSLELTSSDDNAETVVNITRRLGNARNELGKLYMKAAVDLADSQQEVETPSAKEQTLWKRSYGQFDKAMETFEATKDMLNLALVNCNLGRLMRICAQAYNTGKFSQQERHYFNKAIDYYHTALRQLGDKNVTIKESVSWELSTTYFTMATLLQDNAPLADMAEEQVVKDIKEFMMKALKYCEVDESSPRQSIVQYRAATVHHRLASMHHNAYRNQINEQKKKHCRTLAELHYGKAVKLFQELDRPSELLRILLERGAMCEHLFNSQTGSGAKIKTLQTALDFLLQGQQALSGICGEISECLSEDQTDGSALSAPVNTNANKTLEMAQTGKQDEEVGDSAGRWKTQESDSGVDNSGKEKEGVVASGDKEDKDINESAADVKVNDEENPDVKENQCMTKEQEERETLLTILQSRLQFVLLHLVKLHSNKKSDLDKLLKYKKMYAVALSSVKVKGSLTRTMLHTIEQITKMWSGS
ncbi:erythroid differentiation-related factor 1-like [Ptychodera flava]|uniref:erythroid differentiation-related factor 1-like n=1 Tax=Ptychodera flava TaxID=63121 RepID=UPI00396A8CC9